VFVAFIAVSVCYAGSDVTSSVAVSSATFNNTNMATVIDGNCWIICGLYFPTALLAKWML